MSKVWKDLEYQTATVLKGKRNIRISYGIKIPDVNIPDFPNFKVDSKHYRKFSVYTLYEEVKKRYCKEPEDEPILVLRQHGKKKELAVIDLELLGKFLDYIRKKGDQDGFNTS